MLKRTVTGVIMAIIALPVLIFSGTPVFPAAVAILSVIALYEIHSCIGTLRKYAVSIPTFAVAGALPFCARFMNSKQEFLALFATLAFILVFYLFVLTLFGYIKISKAAEAFGLAFYIICGFTSLVLLRDTGNGKFLVYLVLVGTCGTDVSAYLVGRLCGRHKLIPSVSPKKTVEGAIGGIAGCTLLFWLYGFIISNFFAETPKYYALIISGVVISVMAQLGDLIMSVIKREYGIKDYGNILPGHGGILDRFDSMLAVAPFLLIFCLKPDWFSFFF